MIDSRFKNIFLLIASLLFYAWGEPKFVFVMIFSIFINYLFGLLVVQREAKTYQRMVLFLMVLFNLSLFFVFKYLNFTIENINRFSPNLLPQTNIALPIGISFFTFQAMSYVFDVQRGRGSVQKNPFNVALYIALFPQLIAGPIVRYETVAKEIKERKVTVEDFAYGIKRFIIGLFKKSVFANSLAIIADKAFTNCETMELSVLLAWLGIISYALQVYFDFSGYSDMAIGLGRMFGFHFDENFNYPYISKTVAEFWQRWHISLGSWFRDYMFFPISTSKWSTSIGKKAKMLWGRRAGKVIPGVISMAIVWFCTGIWHGASWTYIIWGCYYGFLLILSFIFQPEIAKLSKKLGFITEKRYFAIVQGVRTLLLVLIADVFFRAPNMHMATQYLQSMFSLCGNKLVNEFSVFLFQDNLILLVLASLAATPIFKYINLKLETFRLFSYMIYVFLFILSISYIINTKYNPFIYFNF